MATLTLCLTIFIVLGGMLQVGFNSTSYNTIHSHVERFINETNEEIREIKTQNISQEDLKTILDQKAANLNGWFQLSACVGAMFSIPLPLILPHLTPKLRIICGTKAGLWIPIILSILGSVLSTCCVKFRSYGLLLTATVNQIMKIVYDNWKHNSN